MTDDFDPKAAELTERLRALGSQPVDPPLASAHLTAMAAVRPVGRLRHRVAVAGALFAGTLIGSTGLAAAGALPRTVQDAASAALAKVDISVPVGTERYDGPECVGDTPARNRGQYLKQERAKGKEAFEAAKATKCGMPLSALAGDDEDEGEEQAASTTSSTTTTTAAAAAQGSGKPEEPGKSVCVDRGQGNAGGLGKDNKPEEPGQPSDPGKPASAGKPDDTGKPDETGQPACTEPSPAGQGTGQAPAADDADDDDDEGGNGKGGGKPATVPPVDPSTTNPSSSVRPS